MNKKKIKKELLSETEKIKNESAMTDRDLELINQYTRKNLTADEVYVFPLILCDNDIDRDSERFTVESLFKLEKMFPGKTGIFDHNPSASCQAARIFDCEVENVSSLKTKSGDDYFRLKARAYIPKTESSRKIIDMIEGGIIKEVSVGCAVEETLCSICGESLESCSHRKGEVYGGKICCGELVNPYDAYEWSFVAVPSQRRAGVIKSFEANGKEERMENILKNLETKKGFCLSDRECEKLGDYVNELKKLAKDGAYYRESLTGEVLRLSAIVQPEISRDTMESVLKGMTIERILEFKTAYENRKNKDFTPVPQLFGGEKNKNSADLNGQFRI